MAIKRTVCLEMQEVLNWVNCLDLKVTKAQQLHLRKAQRLHLRAPPLPLLLRLLVVGALLPRCCWPPLGRQLLLPRGLAPRAAAWRNTCAAGHR